MAFPETRPVGYNENAVFDESLNDWTTDLSDLTTGGGERIKSFLVVVSEDNKIYFGG